MLGGRGRGGARGRDDGRVHSHGREPHFAAPLGARAGVGQPVLLRGSEEQPEELKLHGVGCGAARGRLGGNSDSADGSHSSLVLHSTPHAQRRCCSPRRLHSGASHTTSNAVRGASRTLCRAAFSHLVPLLGSAFAERTRRAAQCLQRRKTRRSTRRSAPGSPQGHGSRKMRARRRRLR